MGVKNSVTHRDHKGIHRCKYMHTLHVCIYILYAEVKEIVDTFFVIEGDVIGMNLPLQPRFPWLLILSYLRLEIRTVPASSGNVAAHRVSTSGFNE